MAFLLPVAFEQGQTPTADLRVQQEGGEGPLTLLPHLPFAGRGFGSGCVLTTTASAQQPSSAVFAPCPGSCSFPTPLRSVGADSSWWWWTRKPHQQGLDFLNSTPVLVNTSSWTPPTPAVSVSPLLQPWVQSPRTWELHLLAETLAWCYPLEV